MFDDCLNKLNLNFDKLERDIRNCQLVEIEGKIISIRGNIIIASMKNARIGSLYRIVDHAIDFDVLAEVIAIEGIEVKLMPYGLLAGLSKQTVMYQFADNFSVKINDNVLGCVLDGLGNVIGKLDKQTFDESILDTGQLYNVIANAPNALSRPVISDKLLTGVSVLDLFITCGRGQRLAIFSGPGMGKSTLLGMIARNTEADVVVVALTGERGREVNEFIELELSSDIYDKCVVIVATSDKPPIEQIKSPFIAQTVAEYFRDQGKHVLLLLDSITRCARAQREIGFSAGEAVARGGFPASAFLMMPKLMERAGTSPAGSITAFYTVLMEGNDISSDPIADEVKSIVDGHIILTQELANIGHFPAVDVVGSLSRVADRLIDVDHLEQARHIRHLISKFRELEFLIRIGEYKPGNDKIADEAVDKYEKIMQSLQQDRNTKVYFNTALSKMMDI